MCGDFGIRKSFLSSFQCVSWGTVYWAVVPLWCSPKHDLISHYHTCTVAECPVRVTADVKLSYRVSPVTRKSVQKRPVVGALFILSEMIFTCLMLQGALQRDLQFTLLLQWVLWFLLVSFLLSPFYFRVFFPTPCVDVFLERKHRQHLPSRMSPSQSFQGTEVILSLFWYTCMLLVW